MSVMTSGHAPAARAQSNVARPIGPAPQMSAASPKRRFARSTAASATESGSSSAPSSKERDGGSLWHHKAGCAI